MNMYLQTTEGNITMYIRRIFIDRFRLIKIFFAQNAFYLLFQCNGHLKWSIIIIINVKVEHNSSNINNVERLVNI